MVRVQFLYTGYRTKIRYDHFIDGYVKDPSYYEILNSIFTSMPYGPLKVLKFIGINSQGHVIVEVQFMNSGNIINTTLNAVKNCAVVDPKYIPLNETIDYIYRGNVDMNRLYTSNSSGNFKILSIFKSNNSTNCVIKFVLTGYEKIVKLKDALLGAVRDDAQVNKIPFDKNLILDYDKWVNRRLEVTWGGIINRCDNESAARYDNYGGIGIKLAPEWYNLDTFINDCKLLFQFDKYYNNPMDYQIDKDYLQMNIPKSKRIYSKNTCVFLHYFDNENLRAIEYYNENKDRLTSQYFGVSVKTPSSYTATTKVKGNTIIIGTFSNEIAAASAFNYWHRYYHAYELVPLFNNIPEMPPQEFIKYNTNTKQLYSLIR